MTRYGVTLEFTVNLPVLYTQEWNNIYAEWKEQDEEGADDFGDWMLNGYTGAQLLELIEDAMVYYLVEGFHVGNHTDIVQLVHDDCWTKETPETSS